MILLKYSFTVCRVIIFLQIYEWSCYKDPALDDNQVSVFFASGGTDPSTIASEPCGISLTPNVNQQTVSSRSVYGECRYHCCVLPYDLSLHITCHYSFCCRFLILCNKVLNTELNNLKIVICLRKCEVQLKEFHFVKSVKN